MRVLYLFIAVCAAVNPHNTKSDDAYMAKVFDKFTSLGVDSEGNETGARILTKFNAKNAAREIIGRWKNVNGTELDQILDEKFEKEWKNIDYEKTGMMDLKGAYYFVRTLAGEEYFSG